MEFLVFFATIAFCEAFIYSYHRYAGHEVEMINFYHRLHHIRGPEDQALDELGWVLYLAIIFFLGILYLRMFKFISYRTSVAMALGLAFSFASNWLMHQAYHIPNHPLSKFAWFRRLKKNHDVHHKNGKRNFGITNPILDYVFESYSSGDERKEKLG